MKKSIFLVLIACCQVVFSQIDEPIVYDTNWHLREVNVAGVDHPVPYNSEVEDIRVYFTETSPHIRTIVCKSLTGDIDRIPGEFAFNFSSGITLSGTQCDNSVNTNFENIYFFFFIDNITERFDFEITFIDDPVYPETQLLLKAPNGDFVMFSDLKGLFVKEELLSKITMAPNPVENEFFLMHSKEFDLSISIYNAQGSELLVEKIRSNEKIDVSNLRAGLYLLKIKTPSGEQVVFKLIKK